MKLAIAYLAMVLSTLVEGFWGCFFKGEPPFTQHQALINGTVNAILVLSYYYGFWVVLAEQRKKTNEN